MRRGGCTKGQQTRPEGNEASTASWKLSGQEHFAAMAAARSGDYLSAELVTPDDEHNKSAALFISAHDMSFKQEVSCVS